MRPIENFTTIGFKRRPQSLEDLKERIRQEIDDAIPAELTRRVKINIGEPLQQCIDNDGHHLSDIMFKTHKKKILFHVLFKNIFSFFFLVNFFHFLYFFKM